MLRSVLGKIIWERRLGMLWWTGGLVALALITVAFVPTIRDQSEFVDLLESLPESMLALFGGTDAAEFVTPVGLINSRLYASIGSIIVIALAISIGTRAIAGDEETGTMDMLLSQPVTRTRLVIDATIAMTLLCSLVGVALGLTLVVTNPIFDLDLSMEGVVAANVGVVLLAVVHGTLALLVGAVTGNRAITLGVATFVLIAGFFINGLSELVTQLETVVEFMPFHWFVRNNPLANGFDWGSIVLMTGTSIVLVALAAVAFSRRDIAV